MVFSCVGTPDNPDGSSKLDYVFAAAKEAAKHLAANSIFVQKSTVPVGTGKKVAKLLPSNVSYLSNPEFLSESTAVLDTLLFDRVVVGGHSKAAINKLFSLHRSVEENSTKIAKTAGLDNYLEQIKSNSGSYISTTLESAELIKVSANAFLATKISFANSIAKLCDETGADITEVMGAVGVDQRIGAAFLNAGRGYGGGCFPKDVSGLIASGQANGVEMLILNAVQTVNKSMPGYILSKALTKVEDYVNKNATVLGLSFKTGTSDTRKSAGIFIANMLTKHGVNTTVYDPEANEEAKPDLDPSIKIADNLSQSISNAEIIFITTAWPEFSDLISSVEHMVVVDCMNAYSKSQFKETVTYIGVGKNQ